MRSTNPVNVCSETAPTLESEKPTGGSTKRLFDCAFAVLLIILIGCLFAVVAVGILVLDGRPIFIRHRRIGKGGAVFGCLKFRTMVVNADEVLEHHLRTDEAARAEWAETRKLKNDPRVTPIGHVLRKLSIDELPQIINVLKGEMSLVGPRPIVREEVSRYGAQIADYYRARPGLTGPWQVSGRNDVTYATRVLLDRDYVQHWSFGRDVRILLRTIPAVLSARGVY